MVSRESEKTSAGGLWRRHCLSFNYSSLKGISVSDTDGSAAGAFSSGSSASAGTSASADGSAGTLSAVSCTSGAFSFPPAASQAAASSTASCAAPSLPAVSSGRAGAYAGCFAASSYSGSVFLYLLKIFMNSLPVMVSFSSRKAAISSMASRYSRMIARALS